MLPIARYRRPEDPALLTPRGPVASGAFFSRARGLAAALPEAPYAINRCTTRLGFMLGYAAALIRGQVSLLPPGPSRSDWERLPARYPGAYVLDEALVGEDPMGGPAPTDAAPPAIPADQVAAILFTSGSTGEPAAHAKSWGQLCRGAAMLAEALGWRPGEAHAIVGSVPPQHMFGLESTVMLPWQSGIAVHTSKPLTAADLESAMRDATPGTWWMTTPLHLRAPLQARGRVTGLQGVLASTMSLPADLAIAAEDEWHVPVLEIYGSTEGGALAIRRTAREERWTPLPGVVLRDEGDAGSPRFTATSPHVVPGGVALGDLLELGTDGRFLWLGRIEDLVKVAGKRASRAALEGALLGIPGVEDGAFTFVPPDAALPGAAPESHPARRLAAFYVSATLAPAAVMAALRSRIDPAFLPRPLHRVERLPRNANGKLPKAALDALFEQCRAQVVAPDHPSLPGHFPGDPVVPGALLLGRVAEALRQRFPDRVPVDLRHARFHAPLRPGLPFTLETVEDGDGCRFRVRLSDGTLIASGHWVLEARPG